MQTKSGEGVRLRAALFLDLENIVHPERMAGDLGAALARVDALLGRVRDEADLVHVVAVCDRRLARDLGADLYARGVRVFAHRGGVDAADRDLIDRLAHDVPASCALLVIASGDHAFRAQAVAHRARGRRVQIVARAGSISADLYRVVDDCIHLEATAQVDRRVA